MSVASVVVVVAVVVVAVVAVVVVVVVVAVVAVVVVVVVVTVVVSVVVVAVAAAGVVVAGAARAAGVPCAVDGVLLAPLSLSATCLDPATCRQRVLGDLCCRLDQLLRAGVRRPQHGVEPCCCAEARHVDAKCVGDSLLHC